MNIGDTELKLVRIFGAHPNTLFDAWTDPKAMKKWFAPRNMEVGEMALEAKVGGKFRVCMVNSKKEEYCASGEIKKLEAPFLLALSFAWENNDGENGNETGISVSLEEFHGMTIMNFEQKGFASVESRDSHEEGWCTCFEKLAEFI